MDSTQHTVKDIEGPQQNLICHLFIPYFSTSKCKDGQQ